mgnify:FL=1
MSYKTNTDLRELDIEKDAEALHEIFGDPDSCKFLRKGPTDSVTETVERLKDWAGGFRAGKWAIADTQTDKALGLVSLFDNGDSVWEIDIMVAPSWRGCGIGEDSLKTSIDYAFGQLRARRIEADIDPDNDVSLRLFERLGFQQEGYLREAAETHLGVRDTVLMALLNTDERPE